MFVESADPMKIGTLLRMEMTFPNGTEPVSAVARVVWTREAAAATADLPGASYVGPDGPLQMRGHPRVVNPRRLARDAEAQRRLWLISEEATGVRYLDDPVTL